MKKTKTKYVPIPGPAGLMGPPGQTGGLNQETLFPILMALAPAEPAMWFEPLPPTLTPQPEYAAPCAGCDDGEKCRDTLSCRAFREWKIIVARERLENRKLNEKRWRYEWAKLILDAGSGKEKA
jgi:hypothetical protein